MIKETMKILMVLSILFGLAFSFSNFTSESLKANNKDGYDLWLSGVHLCPFGGTDCDTDLTAPEPG